MPYEYRNLTSKQQEEIVARREAMGFPPHAPPHPFRESGYYTPNGVNFNFYFWLNSGISGFEISNRCEACND